MSFHSLPIHTSRLIVSFVAITTWLCFSAIVPAADAGPPEEQPAAGAEVLQLRGWPASRDVLIGRITLEDHGLIHGVRVLSVVVELKNQSAYAVDLRLDPEDSRLELFDKSGKPISEAYAPRSGPIPITHRATITPGAYAGLSTFRGGIGLPPNQTLLAANRQDWNLLPGTYALKGSVTVTATHHGASLDPLLTTRDDKTAAITPVSEQQRLDISLAKIVFTIEK